MAFIAGDFAMIATVLFAKFKRIKAGPCGEKEAYIPDFPCEHVGFNTLGEPEDGQPVVICSAFFRVADALALVNDSRILAMDLPANFHDIHEGRPLHKVPSDTELQLMHRGLADALGTQATPLGSEVSGRTRHQLILELCEHLRASK
jgi:hypothetical protein